MELGGQGGYFGSQFLAPNFGPQYIINLSGWNGIENKIPNFSYDFIHNLKSSFFVVYVHANANNSDITVIKLDAKVNKNDVQIQPARFID